MFRTKKQRSGLLPYSSAVLVLADTFALWRRGAAVVLFLTIAGLSGSPHAAHAQSSPKFGRRTIIVSVDGLRSDIISRLGPGRIPAFFRLSNEGASTLNARNDPDFTITLPNHTSMITGRYVMGENGHAWTTNEDQAPIETLHSNKGAYVASVFDVVHDEGGRTGLFVTKEKFSLFDESYNASNGAEDTSLPDFGKDKIDDFTYSGSSGEAMEAFIQSASTSPFDFAFIHLFEPDQIGHIEGWSADPGSPYAAAVETVDDALVRLLNFIDLNSDYSGATNLILTADHGGSGGNHVDASVFEHYQVPFFVWGDGVTENANLYELNEFVRQDPGIQQRPESYPALFQPIRNSDASNLALSLMDLPSIPGSTLNVDQVLRVSDATEPEVNNSITISFQDGMEPAADYHGTRDTKIRSDAPSVVFGTDVNLEVDAEPNYAALLKWDLSPLPENATLLSASIHLHVTNVSTVTYQFYSLKREWNEASTTWMEATAGTKWQIAGAASDADHAASSVADVTGPSLGPIAIELNSGGVAALQGWLNNPASNQGFIIQNYQTADDGLDFASREISEPTQRPRLEIVYTTQPAPSETEPLEAQFTLSSERASGQRTVTFEAEGDGSGPNDADSQIVSWFWDFGDNTTANGPDAQHTYSSPGTYQVQLTVTNELGERASAIKLVTLEEGERFSIAYQDGSLPLPSYEGTSDTKLRSDDENTNFGADESLFIDGSPLYSTLLRWDVSSIAPGIEVTGASLTFNITDPSKDQYSIMGLGHDWNESTATWLLSDDGIPWSSAGAAGESDRTGVVLGVVTGGSLGPSTLSLNADGLDLVARWINEPSSNFGIVIQEFVGADDGIDFLSSEVADPLLRPRLDISYQVKHHINAPDQLPFQAYPNPFHSDVSIVFDTSIRHAVELELYDMLGRRIISQTVDPFQFGAPLRLDTSFLAAGVYAVVMREHGSRVSKTHILTKGY